MKHIIFSTLLIGVLVMMGGSIALAANVDWGVTIQVGSGNGAGGSGSAFNDSAIPSANDTILAGGRNGVVNLLGRIANWLFAILMVLAVIFIILAAYQYLISGGGDGVSKAHKMLIYAAIAIAVGLLSRGIVYVVAQLVTR